MSAESPTIEPLLSDDAREELGHLNYLEVRMKALIEQGRIANDSYDTIVSEGHARRAQIVQEGRYQAAIARAKSLAKTRPGESLDWAERATQIDPSRLESWVMLVDVLLGDRGGRPGHRGLHRGRWTLPPAPTQAGSAARPEARAC